MGNRFLHRRFCNVEIIDYLCGVLSPLSAGLSFYYSDTIIYRDMDEALKKKLSKDPNGLMTYEYIANNIDSIGDQMPEFVDNMILVDHSGQFVVSTARYLHAIDAKKYASSIDKLVKSAIEKDREHVYLADLIASLWGADYKERAAELSAGDDNFRRIFKRLYPVGI